MSLRLLLPSGFAAPSDLTRTDYLDVLWTGPADNFAADAIEGKIIACPLSLPWPNIVSGAQDLGVLDGDQSLAGISGGIKVYEVDQLDLDGSDTITVDTTAGPVYLYLTGGPFSMRGTSRKWPQFAHHSQIWWGQALAAYPTLGSGEPYQRVP